MRCAPHRIVFFCAAMKQIWPWACAVWSGLLLALCYPPFQLGGLSWIALTPLISAIWFAEPWQRREHWRPLLLGYVTGAVYFLGCLHWIITVTTAGWIALSLYVAVYPAIWAAFVGFAATPRQSPFEAKPVWMKSWNNLRVAALAAAAWAGLEWIRGEIFTGFGWNALGIALHENVALIQITDITGVAGLSFLLVMVNMMIVITVKRLKTEIGRHRLRPHYDFSLTVAIVALVFGYGARQLFEKPAPAIPLTVAAVQANVPILVKRDPEREEAILDLHKRLTEAAIATRPDLLIWPEAATPRPLFSDQRSWDVVRSLAESFDGDFLLGTVHFANEGDFNSVVLLSRQAKDAALYHKVHLVPFGEYVPLRDSFPLFAWIVGDLVPDDFDFGPGPKVLQLASKPVKVGPLICFEDTLGDLARKFVRQGAQIFVTVTNDGWFLKSAGSQQHVIHALFRCAETKIPMVRAANTGVSCVIDRFGRIRDRLRDESGDTFIEGFFTASVEVPRNPGLTFYVRNGEVFALACLGTALAAAAVTFFRRKS